LGREAELLISSFPRPLVCPSYIRRYLDQRKVAIYPSKVMSTHKNSMVAKHFGICPQAVTNIITEIEGRLEESNRLRRETEEIKCIL